MSTRTKVERPAASWRSRARIGLPLAWMGVIFFLSGRSDLPAGPSIPGLDKFVHGVMFFVLASLWLWAIARPAWGWRTSMLVLLLTSAYGALDELHQSFTPGRMVEVADWVADTVGAAAAISVFQFCVPFRRMLERRAMPADDSVAHGQNP